MRRRFWFVAAFTALVMFTMSLRSQALTPQTALMRLFKEPLLQSDWFDPRFLAQVPVARIEQLLQQLTGGFGPFVRVDVADGRYSVVLERAVVATQIALDANGRITGLLFSPPVPNNGGTLDGALAEFTKLSGRVSVVVLEDGKIRASLQPDRPLAVGSSFKLAILDAIREQVAAGRHQWQEVVPLRREWKSLPSGVFQTWPDDTPLTLAALANQMISVSDNTAADAMLALAGREAVELRAPRNKPFLSTREMFVLKSAPQAGLLQRYRSANEAGKRALLPEIDGQPLPAAGQLARTPTALDVEWFFTPQELCVLMAKVEDLPALHINPGAANPADWAQVAFKGGSEPGVINLTTALVSKSGKRFCVSATWNDEAAPVDETRFIGLYSAALRVLQ